MRLEPTVEKRDVAQWLPDCSGKPAGTLSAVLNPDSGYEDLQRKAGNHVDQWCLVESPS